MDRHTPHIVFRILQRPRKIIGELVGYKPSYRVTFP